MQKKYTIQIDNLQEEFTLENIICIVAPAANVKKLMNENSEYKADVKELKEVIYSILKLLGILDTKTGTIKETIKSGEEGYFKHIAKSLTSTAILLGRAQMSKSAQAELEEKFSFIKNFIPIADKYANK